MDDENDSVLFVVAIHQCGRAPLNAFFSTLIAPILTHRHRKFAFLFGIYANNIEFLREKDVNRQRSFSARG